MFAAVLATRTQEVQDSRCGAAGDDLGSGRLAVDDRRADLRRGAPHQANWSTADQLPACLQRGPLPLSGPVVAPLGEVVDRATAMAPTATAARPSDPRGAICGAAAGIAWRDAARGDREVNREILANLHDFTNASIRIVSERLSQLG